MFKVGVYESQKRQPQAALQELLGGFYREFPHLRPKAAIVYSSWSQDKGQLVELLQGISTVFPAIELVGCTASAGFTSSDYIKEGYFLSLFISDSVSIKAGMVQGMSRLQNRGASGAAIKQAFALLQSERTSLALLFSAYKNINCEQLIAETRAILSERCGLFGAVASDFWSESQMRCFSETELPMERMFQFLVRNGEVMVVEDAVAFLTFSDPLSYDVKIAEGWQEVSHRFALQVEGNQIVRISGEKACLFLKEWEHPLLQAGAVSLHFPFFFHEGGKEPYQRDVFYDRERQLIHFAGETIAEGARISFSDADAEFLRHDYGRVMQSFEDDYALAMTIASVSRIPILAEKSAVEARVQSGVFHNTPVLAGYFLGEITAKECGSEKSQLLSCSSVTLCLREERRGKAPPQQAYREKVASVIQQLEQKVVALERKAGRSIEGEYAFFEDVLGLILASPQFNKNSAEIARYLDEVFKRHYGDEKPPYGIRLQSLRNRLSGAKKKAEMNFVRGVGVARVEK